MKRMLLIACALLLLPGCGLLGAGYVLATGDTGWNKLAVVDEAEREWTNATLTSVDTGEREQIALEASLEAGAPLYIGYVEEGVYDIELTGRDPHTGEPVRYELQDYAVAGEEQVIELEAW